MKLCKKNMAKLFIAFFFFFFFFFVLQDYFSHCQKASTRTTTDHTCTTIISLLMIILQYILCINAKKVGISPVFYHLFSCGSRWGSVICSNAPMSPNYFIFMGNFENNRKIDQIETHLANLNRLSKFLDPPLLLYTNRKDLLLIFLMFTVSSSNSATKSFLFSLFSLHCSDSFHYIPVSRAEPTTNMPIGKLTDYLVHVFEAPPGERSEKDISTILPFVITKTTCLKTLEKGR